MQMGRKYGTSDNVRNFPLIRLPVIVPYPGVDAQREPVANRLMECVFCSQSISMILNTNSELFPDQWKKSVISIGNRVSLEEMECAGCRRSIHDTVLERGDMDQCMRWGERFIYIIKGQYSETVRSDGELDQTSSSYC